MATKEMNYIQQRQDKNGNVINMYPVTKRENVYGIDELEKDIQDHLSTVDALDSKQHSALEFLASNCFVRDDTNGKLYKICSHDGDMYFRESDVDIKTVIGKLLQYTSK